MGEYDIYLNGTGFMLAKDSRGNIVPGAAREVIVDPFTRKLSAEEPYERVPIRVGDGAGLTQFDGSSRYEWGNAVDTRSGRALMAPERVNYEGPYHQIKVNSTSALAVVPISSAGNLGVAQRFQVPNSPYYTGIRSAAIMVKRDLDVDYTGASEFTFKAYADDSGKPGTVLAQMTHSLREEVELLFSDRWRNGEWFWLELTFDADSSPAFSAQDYFWIGVFNNQAKVLHWAEDQQYGTTATRSVYTSAWQTGVAAYPLMIKLSYKDGFHQFDSFPRCFQVYRGGDRIERMYCGTNYRILRWNPVWGDGHWTESKTIGKPVTIMVEFNGKLFAACGPATDFWYSDGSVPGASAWTQVTGQQSTAFAVHDNLLWKADMAVVTASEDGTTTWTHGSCTVGEPGRRVRSLVSHGGKLFAVKPEGVFEISYPDTYPATGDPTSNMMLDFSTEKCPRTWVLDWHSGLYFPGLGGVYELKGGVLRNLWEDKVDEGALDTIQTGGIGPITKPYTRPRSWAPLYDHGPVSWTAVHGTTRGVVFARSNPFIQTSELIWFDGRNWHSLTAAGDVDSDGAPKEFGEYITTAFVQDAGGGRGWLWYNEGFGISRIEWPTWTDDTADDPDVSYNSKGQFTTPWFSLPERSKKMLLCKIGLTSDNLGSNRSVAVYYRTVRGANWTSLGSTIASPYAEMEFSPAVTARAVQFQVRLIDANSTRTTCPCVEQLDLFYQTMPELTTTHQLLIDCSPAQSLREAGVDERATSEIVAALKALVGNTSFTYTDPLGGDHTVRVVALTHQPMSQAADPGATERGVTSQVILSLLEL